MGRFLLALALVGCTHGAATSPSWPKAAEREKDGGESIAPHESSKAIAVVEKAEVETKPEVKPEVKPAAVVTEGGAASAVAPAVTQPTDETITTEEIIIEIDD